MQRLSMDDFNMPPEQHYHIYRINSSKAAEVPHSHEYFQICYVDRGEVEHCAEQGTIRLRFGDAFIVPPSFSHRIVFPSRNSYIYSLAFDEYVFSPGFHLSNASRFLTMLKLDAATADHLETRLKVSLEEQQRVVMKHLFEALLKAGKHETFSDFSPARSIIAAVIYMLAQAYFSDQQHSENYEVLRSSNEEMGKCLEYLDVHYTDDLSIPELAHRFGLSKTVFITIFPRYTGTTFKNYITNKRIEYASVLIRTSQLSFSEISEMAGYHDYSTFYRNFVKLSGITPQQFRDD